MEIITKLRLACLIIASLLLSPTYKSGAQIVTAGATGQVRDATWITNTVGGSGLGVMVASGITNLGDPVALATKCCQDRCYCGSVTALPKTKYNYIIYIGSQQASYTKGPETGQINATSVAEAEAHEHKHLQIAKAVADKISAWAEGKKGQLVTKEYSTEEAAKNKAKHLASAFKTNCMAKYGQLFEKYQKKLHTAEGVSSVINSIWRVSLDANILNTILAEIAAETLDDIAIPQDEDQPNCM
jgi:hypothetical protein